LSDIPLTPLWSVSASHEGRNRPTPQLERTAIFLSQTSCSPANMCFLYILIWEDQNSVHWLKWWGLSAENTSTLKSVCKQYSIRIEEAVDPTLEDCLNPLMNVKKEILQMMVGCRWLTIIEGGFCIRQALRIKWEWWYECYEHTSLLSRCASNLVRIWVDWT